MSNQALDLAEAFAQRLGLRLPVLLAPMAGVVREIRVQPGSAVRAGALPASARRACRMSLM